MYTGQLLRYENWDAESQRYTNHSYMNDKLIVELKLINYFNWGSTPRVPQLNDTKLQQNMSEKRDFVRLGFEYEFVLFEQYFKIMLNA